MPKKKETPETPEPPTVEVQAEQVTATEEPKRRTQEVKESLRVDLTNEQLIELGRELAGSQSELTQLENDAKSVRDEWKSKISAVEARITSVAGRISRGYDFKPVACEVIMDMPDPGLKSCFRLDSGERVWVKEMSDADKQLLLDLEAEEEAAASAEETTEAETISAPDGQEPSENNGEEY